MPLESPPRFRWAIARLLLVLFVFLATAATTTLAITFVLPDALFALMAETFFLALAAGLFCAVAAWRATARLGATPIAAVLLGAYSGGQLLSWSLMVMFLMGYWPFPTIDPGPPALYTAAAGVFAGGVAGYFLWRQGGARSLAPVLPGVPTQPKVRDEVAFEAASPSPIGKDPSWEQEDIPTPVRAVLAVFGLLAGYFLSYWIYFSHFDNEGRALLGRGMPMLSGLALAAIIWAASRRLQQRHLVSMAQGAIAMVAGAVALAGLGFFVGFFVSLLVVFLFGGESNLAPIWILILAPLGFILGGILGGVLGALWYWRATRRAMVLAPRPE